MLSAGLEKKNIGWSRADFTSIEVLPDFSPRHTTPLITTVIPHSFTHRLLGNTRNCRPLRMRFPRYLPGEPEEPLVQASKPVASETRVVAGPAGHRRRQVTEVTGQVTRVTGQVTGR